VSAAATLLRLAVAALDRNDASGARELLAAVLALPAEGVPTATRADLPEIATLASFARSVDASPRTVRRWIAAGRVPASAVVGQGRGLRVDVQRALQALREGVRFDASDAGRAHVARRARLRVIDSPARKGSP